MLRLTQKQAFKLMTAMSENRKELEPLSLAEGTAELTKLTGIELSQQSYGRYRVDLGWSKLRIDRLADPLEKRVASLEDRLAALEKDLGK